MMEAWPEGEHWYRGGWDCSWVVAVQPELECGICLLVQRDAVQTPCGHRYCGSCLAAWLDGSGTACPACHAPLTRSHAWRDRMADRNIGQLLVFCPAAERGCTAQLPLAELQTHIASDCLHQLGGTPAPTRCEECGERAGAGPGSLTCPHTRVACGLAGLGCTARPPRNQLAEHMQGGAGHHTRLLADRLAKLEQVAGAGESGEREAGSEDRTRLYRRLVSLEQRHTASLITISRLEAELAAAAAREAELAARCCGGDFVWRLAGWSALQARMTGSSDHPAWSRGFTLLCSSRN